jgi:hypothetical protein
VLVAIQSLTTIKPFLTILSFIFLIVTKSISQNFTLVSQNKADQKDTGLLYHYIDKQSGFMGADLYIWTNGKFTYRSYTDLAYWISAGTWSINDKWFLFSSNLKNMLGVNISYLTRQTEEKETSRFAIIKDLAGREYPHGAIHVNHDSIMCFYGDLECFGSYRSIDSIKVTITDDVNSTWTKVDPTKGIIQIVLQTNIDLEHYFPFNVKLKREGNKLKPVSD